MLEIKVAQLDKFLAAFMKMPEMVSKEMRKEMKATLSEVQAYAAQNHNYISRTGDLDRAYAPIWVSGSGFEGKLQLDGKISNAPYAYIQHEGGTIPASKIIPKRPGGYLRWISGGEFVFRKRIFKDIVIKAQKFLYNAADKMAVQVQENFDAAIGRAIVKAGF
jgi:hypothetical protein